MVAVVVFPTPPLGDVTEMIDMGLALETAAFQDRFRSNALMEAYGGSLGCRSHGVALAWATGANDYRKTIGILRRAEQGIPGRRLNASRNTIIGNLNGEGSRVI